MGKPWNSELERKTPLRSNTPLGRKTRIRPVNRIRRERRFKRAYGSKARVKRINALPCVVCGATPSENAHVISRAGGGTWRDVVPLCHPCHAECHDTGILTFQKRHDVDLAAHAEQVAKRYPANAKG